MNFEKHPKSFFSLFWNMGGIVSVLLLVFGLVFGSIGLMLFNESRLLVFSGDTAAAEVQRKHTRISRNSEGRDRTTYLLEVSFVDASTDEMFTSSVSADFSLWSVVVEGDLVDLHYVPGRPNINSLNPHTEIWFGGVFALIGILVILGAFGFGLKILGYVASARRSVHVPAQTADVLGVFKTNIEVNKRPLYRLRFRAEDGREGESCAQRLHQIEGVKEGDRVSVHPDLKTGTLWWSKDIFRF